MNASCVVREYHANWGTASCLVSHSFTVSATSQVQKQFNTLPAEDRLALLGSLQVCLQQVTQRCTPAISPLAVALAAMVVQWQAWEGSLQQIGAPPAQALTASCNNPLPCTQRSLGRQRFSR